MPQRMIQVSAIVVLFAGGVVLADGARDRSNLLTGAVRAYTVQPRDSLVSIGARFGVSVATLRAANRLGTTSLLKPGQALQVDNRHVVPPGGSARADVDLFQIGGDLSDGITINIPQRMLFVVRDGRVVYAFPVAVGRADWPSPIGEFTIAVKEIDPTWDVPSSIQRELAREGKQVLARVPAGPGNPLGDRWMGLNALSVGIHGTNAPGSVFRFTTHGCFRLHRDDARALFDAVEVGTPVRVIYEPVIAAMDENGQLWLEVNPDAYRRAGNLSELALALMRRSFRAIETVDVAAVQKCAGEARGRPCLVNRIYERCNLNQKLLSGAAPWN